METDDILDRMQASLDGFPTYVPGLVASAKDEIARLRAELEEAQRAIRNALNFTRPQHDKAMWRVAAIERLPAAERDHFYDQTSRQRATAAAS